MKKKPPAPIRAPARTDEAMARFDRLLATLAPKVETKRQPTTKARKTRGPKPRKPKT